MKTLSTAIETEYLLLLLLIMAASLLLCVFEIAVFKPFRDEIRFYRLEISRSTGDEKEFWKREYKYFYIRSIPFVGKLIYKKMRKRKRKHR